MTDELDPGDRTDTQPFVRTRGVTQRLRAGHRCPAGNPAMALTGSCPQCPSADACTVARFHPDA